VAYPDKFWHLDIYCPYACKVDIGCVCVQNSNTIIHLVTYLLVLIMWRS